MKPDEIRSLTGVRGVAALAIMCYHLTYFDVPEHVSYRILPGYLAVDLFFVLSGFVMALSYAASFRRQPQAKAYSTFLRRRFARIYPVYILLTIFVFLLGRLHLLGPFPSLKTLASNIVLLQESGIGLLNPFLGISILGAAWSISTEVIAYLLFPLLIVLALFRSWRLAAMAAIVSAVALVLVAAHTGYRGPLDITRGHSLRPLVRCLSEFTFGLITWRIWRSMGSSRRLPQWLDVALPVAFAILCLIPKSDLLIVALFPVLILQLCSEGSRLGQILGSNIPLLLGEWSYSLYLLHIPSIELVYPLQGVAARMGVPAAHILVRVVIAAMDIVVAGFLFRFVEKPARRKLRVLLEGHRPPAILLDPAAP